MKKCLCVVAVLIIVITMCFITASYAKSIDLAYEVCENLDFEDLSKLSGFTGSFDVQNGVFRADGSALKVNNASYSFSENSLAGAFNLEFDMFVSDIQGQDTISLNSKNKSHLLEFKKENGKLALNCEADNFACLEFGLWYKIRMSFDTANGLSFTVLRNERTVSEKSISTNTDFVFSDISFTSDGSMYIDNLVLSRPLIAKSSSPVIYKSQNLIIAEGRPLENNDSILILASYDQNGNLISTSNSSCKNGSILQSFMIFNNNIKTYRAFLWSSNLYPQGYDFSTENSSKYVSQLCIGNNYEIVLKDKKAYIKTVNLPEEERFKVVLSSSGKTEEKFFTKNDFAENRVYFDMTDNDNGEYSLLISSMHNLYEIPVFQKTFLYRENTLKNDTYIFKVGYPYYFHNNVKKYFSSNKTYSPMFDNGEMFVDELVLKNVFALDKPSTDNLIGAGSVMSDLGYNTYYDDCGIFVISLDDLWCASDTFETKEIFREGFEGNNVNMGIQYWGSNEVSLNYGKSSLTSNNGNYSYKLGTVPSSFIGLKTVFKDFDKGENINNYKLSFWAKCSDDFSGNALGGLAILYKDTVYYPKFPSLDKITTEWKKYEFTVDYQDFFDKDTMTLAVRLANSDNSSHSGCVYIDDVVVTCDQNGSNVLKSEALKCAELFETDYYVFEDFETDNLNWQNLPYKWTCYNWATSNYSGTYGIEIFDEDYGKSVYLGSTEKSFLGLQGSNVTLHKNKKTYSLTADIYVTDDYNNAVSFAFLMNDEKGFAKLIKGSSVGNFLKKGQWNTVTSYFDTDEIFNGEYVSFKTLIYTAPAATTVVSGRVYIDNIKLNVNGESSQNICATISNQSFASWHVLGDDVIYKADASQFDGIDTIEAIVYNSIDEEVFRKAVSVYTLANEGWTWKPDKPGYYEIEFYATRSDGSSSLIVSEYTNSYKDMPENFSLSRRSFAVAPNQTKPIDERNKKLFVSSHATSDTDLKIASILGFYGARIHWVRWGNSATVTGAHTAKNTYNWANVDKQFNNVKNSGLGAISANIYGTPQWAVPEIHRKETSSTVAGSLKYNNYAPEDITNLTDFLKAFIDRYGEDVDVIEFWNEPQTGTTAFWNDSVENFAKMLKAAYTTIKENSDITVSFSGMGNNDKYAQFYDELLDIPDIYNFYDIMAYHGTYNVSQRLNEIAENHGFEPKPWQNSEGYFSNYRENLKITDKYFQAKRTVVSMLENLKAGAEIITMFQMLNLNEEEYRVYTNKFNDDTSLYGIFRNTPHIEPGLSAVAVFNLFNEMTNDFSYVGEDEFGDVRAVLFNNDGKAFIAMWSKSSTDFSVPSSLEDIGGEIVDFEGNTMNVDTLDGRKIYYIKKADLSKATQILGTDRNNVLNPLMGSPYFNAEIN